MAEELTGEQEAVVNGVFREGRVWEKDVPAWLKELAAEEFLASHDEAATAIRNLVVPAERKAKEEYSRARRIKEEYLEANHE